MSIKPILFNTDMARSILDGRKTVTRRVAFPANDLRPFSQKGYPDSWWFRGRVYPSWDSAMRTSQGVMSLRKYRTDDILYVRETFIETLSGGYLYKADFLPDRENGFVKTWRPSIHMPREAARLFLRVTSVTVERLQDITPEQAHKEGVGTLFLDDIGYGNKDYGNPIDEEFGISKEQFAFLWDSTIKPADRDRYGWEANPWVWVIEFERICKEEVQRG